MAPETTATHRTAVVTGSASGIGHATVEVLRSQGHTVIGVDLHDAEIEADHGADAGRTRMVDQATVLSDGRVDGVIAVAGLLAAKPVSVAVDYFGAVATLTGLRPLLLQSPAPRADGSSSRWTTWCAGSGACDVHISRGHVVNE